MEPAAQLLPLTYWAPLGAAMLVVQTGLGALLLRLPRRRLLFSAIGLLIADAVLVAAQTSIPAAPSVW